MVKDERDTDPAGPMITHDDLLSYLVGAVQRIELQLSSEDPPPWAEKLISSINNLAERTTILEEEVNKIKGVCSSRHDNGHTKHPIV
jgi:hypothetical protein